MVRSRFYFLWTAEAVQLLRDLYPTTRGHIIAKRLKIKRGAVYGKAWRLGLGKTKRNSRGIQREVSASGEVRI